MFNNKGFTDSQTIILILLVLLISVLFAKVGYAYLSDNINIYNAYINSDIKKIAKHLNSNVGIKKEDVNYMYGKKVEYIYMLKNKDFQDYINRGDVILEDINLIPDLVNREIVILSLSPFIEDIDLQLPKEGFIGVRDIEDNSFYVCYIKDDKIPFKKISIKDYYRFFNIK